MVARGKRWSLPASQVIKHAFCIPESSISLAAMEVDSILSTTIVVLDHDECHYAQDSTDDEGHNAAVASGLPLG